MSGTKRRNELLAYMESQGFRLVRCARHLVWSDGVVMVVTASSPRTDDNINYARQAIARARRKAVQHEHREVL